MQDLLQRNRERIKTSRAALKAFQDQFYLPAPVNPLVNPPPRQAPLAPAVSVPVRPLTGGGESALPEAAVAEKVPGSLQEGKGDKAGGSKAGAGSIHLHSVGSGERGTDGGTFNGGEAGADAAHCGKQGDKVLAQSEDVAVADGGDCAILASQESAADTETVLATQPVMQCSQDSTAPPAAAEAAAPPLSGPALLQADVTAGRQAAASCPIAGEERKTGAAAGKAGVSGEQQGQGTGGLTAMEGGRACSLKDAASRGRDDAGAGAGNSGKASRADPPARVVPVRFPAARGLPGFTTWVHCSK